MWWIDGGVSAEGPFSDDQIAKRISLNMINSLDRISEDCKNWQYVRDTEFWRPKQKDAVPSDDSEALQHRTKRSVTVLAPQQPSAVSRSSMGEVPLPERFRMESLQPVASGNKVPWGIVCLLAALIMVVIGGVVFFAVGAKSGRNGWTKSSDQSVSGACFDAVKDKIAIIECSEGSGTGFLLEMEGGKTYLMSNEHVFQSSSAPVARLLNGITLRLGEFSVATDRDLARFEVLGCDVKPLVISDILPCVGDVVSLVGNSLGGGVATESKGFIQGVGPIQIESNVEIVHGNSGSPLVGRDGKVLAVAATMKYAGDSAGDWSVKNTRYDGNVRRFAIRFTDVKWKTIDRRRYEDQVADLNEFKKYWKRLWPLVMCDVSGGDEEKYGDRYRFEFNDLDRKVFRNGRGDFAAMLFDLSKSYEKGKRTVENLVSQWQGRKTYRESVISDGGLAEQQKAKNLDDYDARIMELHEKLKKAFRELMSKRNEALSVAQEYLSRIDWLAPQMRDGYSRDMKEESVAWYLEGVSELKDQVKQQTKNFEKKINELERGSEDDDD